jgi:hypothetical protein
MRAGRRARFPAAAFRAADMVSGMRFTRDARVAVLIDACCVLVFVVIGRASHAKGEALGGIAATGWPFLCGLAAGWIAARAWRRPLAIGPAGVVIWLCTVTLGMILRVVSGQGTAGPFIVVALAFLGLFLLGWRLIARLAAGLGRAARHPRRERAGTRRRWEVAGITRNGEPPGARGGPRRAGENRAGRE